MIGIFNTFVTGLGNLSAFSGIVFIYFLPPYLEDPQKLKKISVTAIGIAIIYLILCVSIILLLFSSLLKTDEILPLYSAAQYIEFGVFFQRLESIFLLIWMIQMACYFAITLHFTLHIFKKIANLSDTKPLIFPLGLLMFAVSILPKNYAVKLLVMALIIGTLFFLAYLPWFIKDIKTKKAIAISTANNTQVASAEQAKEENIKEETKSNVDLDSGLNKIESKTTKKSSTKSIKDNRSNKTNKN